MLSIKQGLALAAVCGFFWTPALAQCPIAAELPDDLAVDDFFGRNVERGNDFIAVSSMPSPQYLVFGPWPVRPPGVGERRQSCAYSQDFCGPLVPV